ncbi:Outer membrane protein [Acidisarcina polymorpha]|uniref:Outer membrane protein n=1 Tax=Acidisarcina polymorpha TaxID=2211140 RepID=A0A2Z5FYD0_9BACT|nr:outer membrane protein assembly factor [Acidisarcina polymorpha]AXC11871.1 Outer membrane protein [Acidisarcina polymorpha]
MVRRRILHFGLLCAVLLLIRDLPAQTKTSQEVPKTGAATAQTLSSYEGQNVTSVEIAGRPDLQNSDFAPMFAQKDGQPFSQEKLDQTVAAVKASGKFKEVQLQVQPEPNGVRVLLVLEPAIYIGIFRFPGAEQFAYSRLVQVADFPSQAPFDALDIERDRQSLINFFRQEGYFEAEVKSEVKVDSQVGVANVDFHVTLNRRAKFGNIVVDGVTAEEAARIKASLATLIARGRGAAIRTGKTYRRTTLSKAALYLQTQLQKRGRLNAEVELAGAEFHQDTNQADIHFSVHPGPVVHVDLEGAHLWSWTRKSLLPVYQGIAVDEESVQEGREALISYFQAKGFFDVKVDSDSKILATGDTIVYRISKEKKRKVSEVSVSGNTHLPSSDLTSRLTVQKSHPFSPGNFSEKLVRSSVKNLEAVYQAQGYSSVQVASKVVNDGPAIKVVFVVDEGPRDIVNSLKIEGATTFPETSFAPKGLQLAPGKPYSQSLVQSDRANIVANYLKAGYLTSTFRETAKVVSKNDPHHIDVIYHIYEGPRVYASNVYTLGRVDTQQRLIDQDVAAIKGEQPLTETELLTAESQLYNHTGVFDWAEVDPKRTITTQTQEDVLVKVHEAQKNQITYGFGFEFINRGGSVPSGTVALPNLPPVGLPSTFTTSQTTFYGPRGTFQYTRNNFRGKGETLSFTGFAGRLDQRGAAYYIDPNFRWSPWKSTASISAERNEENPIFSSQVFLGSYQVQRSLDKANADILFLRYSYSKTDLTRIEIPQLVLPQDQHVRLSTIAANLTRDTRDNTLDEHKGVLQTVEFDFNSTKLGSSVDFAKLTAQLAYFRPLRHGIVWANSLRIGLAQPFSNSRVPLSESFFTGGGNTLRGFPLDGAGPQRKIPACSSGSTTDCTFIQVPSGGNELLLINSELRVPLPIKKGLGVVGFYDGGNVFPLVGFHDFTSLYTNNVGLGLRYATPVGPVRIDLGRNLNPIPGIQATQYFISIGQAF